MILHNRQVYKTWKSISNVKMYNKPIIKKNERVDTTQNCPPLQDPYKACGNFKFNSRPMAHYRKTLDLDCSYVEYILNNNISSENLDTCFSAENLVIKRGKTNIDASYSTSNKEYLYKKCKTFNQNLNIGRTVSGDEYISPDCDCNKNTVYTYRNKNYYTDSPITSSARIASIKHAECRDKLKCHPDYETLAYRQEYNNNYNNIGCCDKNSLYKSRKPGGSRIRILK